MADIFLSYAREDRQCAERLAHVLEQAGHQVWWDRRIGTGGEFSAEIEAALEKADIVLVAWSGNSAKSSWVRDEAAAGRDSGRLLPVLIDHGQPPLGFRQFQALDLSGWKGRDDDPRTRELIDSVEVRRGGKAAQFERSKRRFGSLRRRTSWAAALALVLTIGAAALALFLLNGREGPSGALSKPTIALLPFTTAPSDAELRQLASQARDSLAHTFSQSGVPVRRMDSVPQDGRSAVDFLMSGDLSRNGDKVVATVRLDEAVHGVTVFSHRFEAAREDLRDLPERIGAQMAGNLTWSAPMMVLERRSSIDPALMAGLLKGHDFTGGLGILDTYQAGRRVAAKAPDWQSAQLDVAFGTAFVLGQLPRDERAAAVAEARRAADRAIKLGPKFGDTYGTWCLLHSETRRAECEGRLRAGKRIDPDAPFLNTFLSHRLRDVGRFEEATDLARLAHAHDIYVPTKIAWMLRSHEYAGESDAARELYQQAARWWPEFKPMFFRNRIFGLLHRGDFEAMQRLEQDIGAKDLLPRYATTDALAAALKAKSIAAARRACPDTADELLQLRCMLAFAILGDQDSAYAIADKLYPRRVGRTPAETEQIWLNEPDGSGGGEFITSPAAAPMRRDPRYLALA